MSALPCVPQWTLKALVQWNVLRFTSSEVDTMKKNLGSGLTLATACSGSDAPSAVWKTLQMEVQGSWGIVKDTIVGQ